MELTTDSFNFAYYAKDNEPQKGLYVVLEQEGKTTISVLFGNKNRDWFHAEDPFLDARQKGWIGDLELRTEDEASNICKDLGRDLKNAQKTLMQSFEAARNQSPRIEEPQPSLEMRIKAHGRRQKAD